jgi:Xaa-Pro dipeptidase
MRISRRTFVQTSALAAAASYAVPAEAQRGATSVAQPIAALKPFPGKAVPISDDERRARIEKARRLMTENGMGAIVLEPGTSMNYFVNVRWGTSERPFLLVIPATGELAYVAPEFEEARAREITKFTNDIRVWQEDEDWGGVVAGILKDRGVATAKVGVEERVRFFIPEGLRAAAPQTQFVLATPVTAGCRMIKSAAEIALMQRANDITIEAYRAAFATLAEGMTQFEFGNNIRAAFQALGAPGGSAGAQFGEYSAFPHGSITPQKLKDGDVVLVDGGCNIEGYASDITRTTVFGKRSTRQVDVWNLEKAAQAAAFKAAQVGATCESVDAAARKVITDAGFGPDYKVPGLPHRTGHGIGMDGHEWTNFVRGNKTKLAPGMCFSDEPMIAIYGEFGVRLEDCLYITENGPRFFTQPSPAIDKPFA